MLVVEESVPSGVTLMDKRAGEDSGLAVTGGDKGGMRW